MHKLAALCGEGLRPELVGLFERRKPTEVGERKDPGVANDSKAPESSAA